MSTTHIELASPNLVKNKLLYVDSYMDIYYGYNDIIEHGWGESSREDEIEIVDSTVYNYDKFAFFDDTDDDFDYRRLFISFADVHTAIDSLKNCINEESVFFDEDEENDIESINGNDIKTLCKLIMTYYKNYNITDEWPSVKLKEIFESNNYNCGWEEDFSL